MILVNQSKTTNIKLLWKIHVGLYDHLFKRVEISKTIRMNCKNKKPRKENDCQSWRCFTKYNQNKSKYKKRAKSKYKK